MTLDIRRWARPVAALGMIAALTAGCSTTKHEKISATQNSLADMETSLDVQLPPGFYPLKGHFDPENPEDSYNGWPRYIVSTKDGMIMAYVPTQTFMMGGGAGPDEAPARTVVVSHFYMDLHEVTNRQFAKFWKKTKGELPDDDDDDNWCCGSENAELAALMMSSEQHHSFPKKDCFAADASFAAYWVPCVNDSHPARNVNWYEAWAYSQWTSKVLPTEAQWEAAARGDDRRVYPWGNEPQSDTSRYVANTRTGVPNFDGYEYAAPVLSYASGVSPFGIYNLSGNVWEWTADWYDLARYAYPSEEDPPSALERGPKPFGDRNYPNPGPKNIRETRVGPMRGDERVIRGGSFTNPIEMSRVDTREHLQPFVHQNNVGFRCVLPLPPEEATEGG